jgi:hypothetical protein
MQEAPAPRVLFFEVQQIKRARNQARPAEVESRIAVLVGQPLLAIRFRPDDIELDIQEWLSHQDTTEKINQLPPTAPTPRDLTASGSALTIEIRFPNAELAAGDWRPAIVRVHPKISRGKGE